MMVAGRLRVYPDGRVEARRLGDHAEWREPKHELVIAPGRKRSGGYIRVRVCGLRLLLHRLVWLALRGPIPEHLEINHRDGVKTNNALANLELLTPSENQRHAIEHGLHNPYAPKNHSLTDAQVEEIRTRLKTGTESQLAIAKSMGTTLNIVNRIARGRTYRTCSPG